ncbi:hypothetical protein LCGC14_1236270 [marine sediment metagenome]|uniref:Uncharacterized protein n=1 Tax=marine sediment metagenome TaxID=412755 RepID=A0A0F9LB86_9ZZZZ
MREVDYQDERGRKYRVRLPDGVPDSDADKGVPIGPPDVVDELGLPDIFATRLHNALFQHGLWNVNIVRKRPKILFSILQQTLKVDVQLLMEAFRKLEKG